MSTTSRLEFNPFKASDAGQCSVFLTSTEAGACVNHTLTYDLTAFPTVSAATTANICPSATVNLNKLVTSKTPEGATLYWYTNDSHTGDAYGIIAATAGTYYAFYYDSSSDCYSLASSAVTVTQTVCPSCIISNRNVTHKLK